MDNMPKDGEVFRRAGTYPPLVQRVRAAQELRPLLLKQLGYVPECVLEYCNKNRALLAELGE